MRDLRALTLPQPHASLVREGVQTIVTLPRPTDWRGDLLIHAPRRLPKAPSVASGWRVVPHRRHTAREDFWVIPQFGGREDGYRLPLGAVVAVARVTDCVPIVGMLADLPRRQSAFILNDGELSAWGRPWLGVGRADRVTDMGLGDQLPYADFTPGRHALLLDDVRPVHVPDVKGRPGVWTPDPDLTRRVEDAT